MACAIVHHARMVERSIDMEQRRLVPGFAPLWHGAACGLWSRLRAHARLCHGPRQCARRSSLPANPGKRTVLTKCALVFATWETHCIPRRRPWRLTTRRSKRRKGSASRRIGQPHSIICSALLTWARVWHTPARHAFVGCCGPPPPRPNAHGRRHSLQ
jgi:hypothetical protein